MRILLAALGLALVASAPSGAALLAPACEDAQATTARDLAWAPSCLRILSGDVIVFGSVDDVPHNARSAQDDMPLRQLTERCFATANFDAGGSAHVRFFHDDQGVRASVRQADGTWGPAHDCALARDPTTLASGEAAIRFECGVHQGMTGRILVAKVAGAVG